MNKFEPYLYTPGHQSHVLCNKCKVGRLWVVNEGRDVSSRMFWEHRNTITIKCFNCNIEAIINVGR